MNDAQEKQFREWLAVQPIGTRFIMDADDQYEGWVILAPDVDPTKNLCEKT